MKLTLKNYKFFYFSKNLKNKNFFLIIYQTINIKNNSWLKVEQIIFKNNLIYFKIKNTITNIIFGNSIYKTLEILINGSVLFLQLKTNKSIYLTDIQLNSNKEHVILSAIYKNKIYTRSQILNLQIFHYKQAQRSLCFTVLNLCKNNLNLAFSK